MISAGTGNPARAATASVSRWSRGSGGLMMRLVLLVLGGLLVGLTILSRVRSAKWWIRYADFPRMQIAFGLAIVLAAYVAIYGTFSALDAVFALAVGGALLDQAVR